LLIAAPPLFPPFRIGRNKLFGTVCAIHHTRELVLCHCSSTNDKGMNLKHKEVTAHTTPPVCTTMALCNPQYFDTHSTTNEQRHASGWVDSSTLHVSYRHKFRYINRFRTVTTMGRDSSVCIAIGYGLDGPAIESRWGRDVPHPSRTALGSTQPPIQWVPGLCWG
jgi:hypothetical protein